MKPPWEIDYAAPEEAATQKPWEREYAAPGDVPRVEVRGTAESKPKEASLLKKAVQYIDPMGTVNAIAQDVAHGGSFLPGVRKGAADLATGFGKLGTYLQAPGDFISDVATGNYGSNQRRRQQIEQFGQEQGANNWTSMVNQAAPELVATGGPMAGVERKVLEAVGKTALPKVLQKAAGAAADIGVNTAYGTAQGVAKGEDVGDAAKTAAMWSTGGRAAGTVINKLAQAGKALPHATAKFLQDQGINVTPGMLYPGTWVDRMEKFVKENVPFGGGAVEAATGRAGRTYINREAQNILDELNQVHPGGTVLPDQPPAPRPQAAGATPGGVGYQSQSREVGPSMVEPLPNRYPQPPGTIHIDSQGNAGALPERNPAYAADSGLFYSTQASRPPNASNFPRTLGGGEIPRGEPPNTSVGPARPPIPDEILDAPPKPAPAAQAPVQPETIDVHSPLPQKTRVAEGEGVALSNNIKGHIDDAYDQVVDHTYMTARDGISALLTARGNISNLSLLTAQQRRQALDVVNNRLLPEIQGMHPDDLISGRTVKNLDTILGEVARKNAGKAETEALSRAMYEIQHRLRVATTSDNPAYRYALQKANDAYRKWLPFSHATEAAIGSTGVPSSAQYRTSLQHYDQTPDALNNAMVDVSPNAPMSSQSQRRNVGLGVGVGAYMFPKTAAIAAAGAVGSKLLYSERGVKLMIGMLGLPNRTRAMVESLPLAEQIKFLSSQPMATQYGRELGNQD